MRACGTRCYHAWRTDSAQCLFNSRGEGMTTSLIVAVSLIVGALIGGFLGLGGGAVGGALGGLFGTQTPDDWLSI